jgi:hypothetical protein
MTLHVAALAMLLAAGQPQNAPSTAKEAVVQIVATGTGSAGLGTGFFISPDGRVLTCYHVVHGAKELVVISGNQMYRNVEIDAVDPDHDLASLTVHGLPPRVAFLQLSRETPKEFFKSPLETFGHPSVISSQHLEVKATRDEFAKSQEFRNPVSDARLFNLRDVDLISIDLTIYGGLSGAPLIWRNRAVGVISGSFQEGGSIAWAIPVKYSAGMKTIHLPASRIPWPAQTMMASAAKNLRRQANPGLPLTVALERYGVVVDRFQTDVTDGIEVAHPAFMAVKSRLAYVDAQIATRGEGFVIKSDQKLESRLDHPLFEGRLKSKALALADRFEQDRDDLKQVDQALRTELSAFTSRLPDTPKNRELLKTTAARLAENDDIILKIALPKDGPDIAAVTLGDYKREWTADLAWPDALEHTLPRFVSGLRNMLNIFEAIFDAELDASH